MAERRPLVIVGSEVVELPSGDALMAHAVDRGNGFISWTGEATVTPSTGVALLDSTGAALSPTKTYKVAACNIDSSAQRGAVVLFVGDGSGFVRRVIYEQGTSSSNVQLYLNAGVPSVSVYGGSGSYRIPYRIEEVPNFGQALSEFGILQRLLDAPSDGKTYGRKDAMWVEAGAAAGGKTLKQQEFKTSGTWTRPTGVDSVEVLLVGGGGGGGGGYQPSGGGGGGQVIRRVVAVTGNVSVTIGSGGPGGTPTTKDGSQGGTSSFGALNAYGGGGGAGTNGSAPPVVNGGSGGGGNPGAAGVGEGASGGARGGGGAGGAGFTAGTNYEMGGVGLYGFGGGGGANYSGQGSSGGGAGNPAGGSGTDGNPNTGGGGGGATRSDSDGGNGGSGICIVTWWE